MQFTSTGRVKAASEGQLIDAPEVDTEEDLLLVLEDAVKKQKEGKQSASKSKSKKPVQATEGAEAPPEETPPDPKPTKPHTDPAPTEPQPGTSKAPTEDPTQAPTYESTKPAATNPDEDEPPAPTTYVKAYQAAGKEWLDSVVKDGEAVYTRLFDKLLVLGDPYICNVVCFWPSAMKKSQMQYFNIKIVYSFGIYSRIGNWVIGKQVFANPSVKILRE